MDISLATPDDLQDLIPLMRDFNDAEEIVWRPEEMTAAFHRLLCEPHLGRTLKARDPASRSLIGYIIATFGYDLEFAGADAFITELFVKPSFRGRGLGRALLDAMVEHLIESGAKAAHLMVRPDNERARTLYEDNGFCRTPRIMMTRILVPNGSKEPLV